MFHVLIFRKRRIHHDCLEVDKALRHNQEIASAYGQEAIISDGPEQLGVIRVDLNGRHTCTKLKQRRYEPTGAGTGLEHSIAWLHFSSINHSSCKVTRCPEHLCVALAVAIAAVLYALANEVTRIRVEDMAATFAVPLTSERFENFVDLHVSGSIKLWRQSENRTINRAIR